MIDIHNLTKKYGDKVALQIGNLSIDIGEIFGLVGNNGAGKTTFLRALLDLINLNEGDVYLDGVSAKSKESWKAFTGSYLDEGFLIDYLTPTEYFRFVGHYYGFSRTDVEEILAGYSTFLGSEVAEGKEYIRALSAGNKKKVGIVSAMLVQPRILLLDEPFAGLDPTSQFRLHTLLETLHTRRNTTMVISSHNLEHVSKICTRISILEGGNIVRDFKTDENSLEELKSYFMLQN